MEVSTMNDSSNLPEYCQCQYRSGTGVTSPIDTVESCCDCGRIVKGTEILDVGDFLREFKPEGNAYRDLRP